MTNAFPSAASTQELERGAVLAPRFDAAGLVAAVAQHAETGEVLMLAWMNAQALRLTIDTGEAHYYSRSRQALWKKGESSGHVLAVERILVDCDQDALVLMVRPAGAACHTGARSCFYRTLDGEGLSRLDP